jgi:hypothetical protein
VPLQQPATEFLPLRAEDEISHRMSECESGSSYRTSRPQADNFPPFPSVYYDNHSRRERLGHQQYAPPRFVETAADSLFATKRGGVRGRVHLSDMVASPMLWGTPHAFEDSGMGKATLRSLLDRPSTTNASRVRQVHGRGAPCHTGDSHAGRREGGCAFAGKGCRGYNGGPTARDPDLDRNSA